MKRRFMIFALLLAVALLLSSCGLDEAGIFESDESLGKTNNTAVAIAEAMNGYLEKKGEEDLVLYGMELNLNSDGNGIVKLFYAAEQPVEVDYSDIYVAEVDSKIGHVERFESVDYSKDGILPYHLVKEGEAFDASSLPIDSGKAVSNASRIFNENHDFYYDYVRIVLSAPKGVEIYEIEFISMLSDTIYSSSVDAVSGAILSSDIDALD